MTHPHSDQRTPTVSQRPIALSPYPHLVNAPVSPLDPRSSALIPQSYSGSHPVVDGEVITSTLTIPTQDHIDAGSFPVSESKRSLFRRVIDDPYWILMTLSTALGISITATVIYGVIQITLAIAHWFSTNAATITTITVLVILLVLCSGATAAKCTGIHCGGCKS